MMVRYNAVDAELLRTSDHFVLANDGIYADYNLAPVGRRLLDDVQAHAVTFCQAMRDVCLHSGAGRAQCREQHHYSHGAVYIVVAIDQDLLLSLDGAPEASDGGLHVRHEEWIVEVAQAGAQETVCHGRILEASPHQ